MFFSGVLQSAQLNKVVLLKYSFIKEVPKILIEVVWKGFYTETNYFTNIFQRFECINKTILVSWVYSKLTRDLSDIFFLNLHFCSSLWQQCHFQISTKQKKIISSIYKNNSYSLIDVVLYLLDLNIIKEGYQNPGFASWWKVT